jgi:phosphoglycolate phosphatase-like HAD superfamily hydrolase
MNCKLAIYDWNGTIADDIAIAYRCMSLLFEKFAPGLEPPDMATYRNGINNSKILDFYHEHGIPKTTTIDMLDEIWFPTYRAITNRERLRLQQGVRPLLDFCRRSGIPNVIVSGSYDDVEHYIDENSLRPFFREINIKVRHKKTALAEVVDRFSVSPQNAFYLDDTRDGLAHAKEVGLTAIGFTGGFNSEESIRQANPDYVVHSFLEVLRILENGS